MPDEEPLLMNEELKIETKKSRSARMETVEERKKEEAREGDGEGDADGDGEGEIEERKKERKVKGVYAGRLQVVGHD